MTKLENNLNVEFANENDVCDFCLMEESIAREDTLAVSTVDLKKKLAGKLTGQKILKLRPVNIVICKNHLEKILQEINKDQD